MERTAILVSALEDNKQALLTAARNRRLERNTSTFTG